MSPLSLAVSLPPPETLAVFVAAAVALILTPGPDTLFVLAQGAGGRRRGVRAALGVATGVLVHTTLVVLGLAAVLRAHPAAFTVLKAAGGAYLLFLGLRTAREKPPAEREPDAEGPGGYRGGLLVNSLNPKVAVFFLAFLPGFASSADGIAALGGIYAVLTACYLSVVGVGAGKVGQILRARGRVRWLQRGSAVVLVSLAAAMLADVV